MRVLIFGSRTWSHERVIEVFVSGLDPDDVIIAGGAPGADTMAEAYANLFDKDCSIFAARWDVHGRAAGPIRNQQMIDEGRPDCAIGFVDKPLAESRGSADMAGRCQKADIPVYIVTKLPSLA